MTAVPTISELSAVSSVAKPDIPVNPEVFPDDGVFSCADNPKRAENDAMDPLLIGPRRKFDSYIRLQGGEQT